jgi:hypothetical protein
MRPEELFAFYGGKCRTRAENRNNELPPGPDRVSARRPPGGGGSLLCPSRPRTGRFTSNHRRSHYRPHCAALVPSCLRPSGAVRSAHLPVKEKVASSNLVWGAQRPARFQAPAAS